MENVALAAPPPMLPLWGLFMQANWVVKLVMLGLLFASIWTWAIIVDKTIAYGRARRAIDRFEQSFWSGQSLEELYRNLSERRTSGMASIFMAAMREWKKSFEKGARSPIGLQMRIDKAMDVALARESGKLESRLGFRHHRFGSPFYRSVRHGCRHHDLVPGNCRFQEYESRGCCAGYCGGACDGDRPSPLFPPSLPITSFRRMQARSAGGSKALQTSFPPYCRAKLMRS